jgi:hypothetical protein
MAKRFTDTEKWKKPFIRGLQGPYKLLWLYICDDCDHAGVWQVDLEVAEIRIGEKINRIEALKSFGDKIVMFDDGNKWFIPSFIEFQYPSGLNPDNRAHSSIIHLLEKYNLTKTQNKPLVSPSQGRKDMDMVMDMDKDKDKEGKSEKIKMAFCGEEIESAWESWKEYKQVQYKFKYKTLKSEQAAFDELVELSGKDLGTALKIIKQSMAKGWKGLFALKNEMPAQVTRQKSWYEQDLENKRKSFKPIEQHDNDI